MTERSTQLYEANTQLQNKLSTTMTVINAELVKISINFDWKRYTISRQLHVV